jgi:hypothetical protein
MTNDGMTNDEMTNDRMTNDEMTNDQCTNLPVYRVYRDGRGDLKEWLREALRDYYGRHGRLPGSVVVHKSLVREAAEALAALELPRLPVKGVGGCLVPEVWLPIEVE